jgi:hypothetical protein
MIVGLLTLQWWRNSRGAYLVTLAASQGEDHAGRSGAGGHSAASPHLVRMKGWLHTLFQGFGSKSFFRTAGVAGRITAFFTKVALCLSVVGLGHGVDRGLERTLPLVAGIFDFNAKSTTDEADGQATPPPPSSPPPQQQTQIPPLEPDWLEISNRLGQQIATAENLQEYFTDAQVLALQAALRDLREPYRLAPEDSKPRLVEAVEKQLRDDRSFTEKIRRHTVRLGEEWKTYLREFKEPIAYVDQLGELRKAIYDQLLDPTLKEVLTVDTEMIVGRQANKDLVKAARKVLEKAISQMIGSFKERYLRGARLQAALAAISQMPAERMGITREDVREADLLRSKTRNAPGKSPSKQAIVLVASEDLLPAYRKLGSPLQRTGSSLRLRELAPGLGKSFLQTLGFAGMQYWVASSSVLDLPPVHTCGVLLDPKSGTACLEEAAPPKNRCDDPLVLKSAAECLPHE